MLQNKLSFLQRSLWPIVLGFTGTVLTMVPVTRGQEIGNGVGHKASGTLWRRHTIDNTSRGADGIRLADINGDELLDLVTGWEEGGKVRLYLNPGPENAREIWPRVTVGNVTDPEDALLVDLDQDGVLDVVSSCEGKTRTMYVHWGPKERDRLLDPLAWKTEAFSATVRQGSWMFCSPLQLNEQITTHLVVGSKQAQAMVGLLKAPEQPRDVTAWQLQKLCDAGWIMSIEVIDMDGDGDDDILFSDRRGPNSGIKWLENPGADAVARGLPWPVHTIGGESLEVMFLTLADMDRDGHQDILAAVIPDRILILRRLDSTGLRWDTVSIPSPPSHLAGTPKGIGAADINGDGRMDILMTCENATGARSGVWWIDVDPFAANPTPTYHDIGGPEGVKFDLIQLVDLDGDGDLDLLTCEERDNLGVIWYENPGQQHALSPSPVK